MDFLEKYRTIVKNLLKEYAQIPELEESVENQLIFDEKNDHYLLISQGWCNQKRIHYCVIHIDIIDGQVWIQANNTERLIAEELVAAGIEPPQIVLGLQPPEVRQFTAYGVPDLKKQTLPA